MLSALAELLESRPWLLADGATGSNLFDMGLKSGDSPELWNLQRPNDIADLHRRFIDAGADIVLTNTFGGNRQRLGLHGAAGEVAAINEAAARIARAEVERCGRKVLVAGSMGPTGDILAPVGPADPSRAREAFAEQARALMRGGVDVLWIETLSSREEVLAALAGAATAGLPVVCTLSFDTNGRTMMGLTPADLAELVVDAEPPLAACGANCGVGPSEVVACLLNLARAAAPGTVLVAKANCGIPQWVDGSIRYDGTAELMGDYARLAVDSGARIVGGCCGTTPEHLRAMSRALAAHRRGATPVMETVVARLGEISSGSAAQGRGEMSRVAGAAPGASTEPRRGRRMHR
jgi:5-methyltetrahydrofolate--homocysteine methyltransferase